MVHHSDEPLFNSSLFCTVYKGSLGARINELKQRVIAENPHRFAVAVPRELANAYTYCPHTPHATETCHFHISCVPTDTTRPKKPHEKEGVEYHFVTKQQFDADALNNKYVPVGLCGNVHDLFLAEVNAGPPQVHRTRRVQGEPVRNKYRRHPLCTSQE